MKRSELSAEQQIANIRARRAQYAKKWREANPDKAAAIAQRYWARKAAEAQQMATGDTGTDTEGGRG